MVISTETWGRHLLYKELPDALALVDGAVLCALLAGDRFLLPNSPVDELHPISFTFSLFGRETPLYLQHLLEPLLPAGVLALRRIYEFAGIKGDHSGGVCVSLPSSSKQRKDDLRIESLDKTARIDPNMLGRLSFVVRDTTGSEVAMIKGSDAIGGVLTNANKTVSHMTATFDTTRSQILNIYIAAAIVREYLNLKFEDIQVPDATSRTTPWTFRLPEDLREVYEEFCREVSKAITIALDEKEARVHIEIFQKVELTAK